MKFRIFVFILVFLTGAVAHSATTSSISQYGITWTFDKAYEYGTYANGDYWVKTDPGTNYVRVTSISPATTTYAGSRVHGWEVNPGIAFQSFDGRTNNKYVSGLMPSLPYNATAGKSLVKAISLIPCDNTACRPVLKTVSVLTVVGTTPDNDGATVFRPPYVGTSKPNYSTSSIRWDRIPSFAPVPNTPSLDSIVTRMNKVQFDHVAGIYGGQTRPKDHLPFYGADINQEHGDAVLRIMLNDSQAAKTPAVIAIIQSGIDHYHFILEGQTWPRGGGEQPGRIITPLVASYLLNDAAMQQTVTARSSDTHYPYEQYILARRVDNRVLWGDTTGTESVYWGKLEGGHSAPGASTIRDPYGYIDGGYYPGAVYQECCTSQGFKQTALIMVLMPGLQNIWGFSDEVIEYADRWVNYGAWTLPDPCAPVGGTRGVHYGPDPNKPGDCIRGSGRFPSRHGVNVDAGARYSVFAAALWDYYRYSTSPPPPEQDTTPPVINSFSLPESSNSLTNTAIFDAEDNIGVAGYAVSLSGGTPSIGSSEWKTTSSVSFVFPSSGTHILYGWVRDAAGNISDRASTEITISVTCEQDAAACASEEDCGTYWPNFFWYNEKCQINPPPTTALIQYTYNPNNYSVGTNPVEVDWEYRLGAALVSEIVEEETPAGTQAWFLSGGSSSVLIKHNPIPAVGTIETLILVKRVTGVTRPTRLSQVNSAVRLSLENEVNAYTYGLRVTTEGTRAWTVKNGGYIGLAEGLHGISGIDGKWVYVRTQIFDDTMRIKVWENGTNEPTAWLQTLTAIDAGAIDQGATIIYGGAGIDFSGDDTDNSTYIGWYSAGINGAPALTPEEYQQGGVTAVRTHGVKFNLKDISE